MKIIYKKGNLLDCEEPYIMHGCNAQGVMQSGVAKAIRDRWSEAYQRYYKVYNDQGGRLYLGQIIIAHGSDKMIINAITQRMYGRDRTRRYISYAALRLCCETVNKQCAPFTAAIALPRIGCGLANGEWSVVEKIIEEEFTHIQPVVYDL